MRQIRILSKVGKIFFSVVLTGMTLWACDQDRIYENNFSIGAGGWRYTDRARFEVVINDTVSLCNIYINARNNGSYKYMELWLFVDVFSPLGTVERDTVQFMLADYRGKWLGRGLGDKFDTRMIFRRKVRFPATGKYVFEYEQATRDESLKGIEDIGLRIEKAAMGK